MEEYLFLMHVYVFALAIFVGFELITIVGAILSAGLEQFTISTILGLIAVAFAMINVIGGFLVTDRMLKMFKKK